ncbi:hypothetical protein [Paenisporosarcina sp. OV554]|uniref:hypothetical protein n=1 Tax=Paenisporosarcina sp. OV554 TaxID=2135694 RepID=UPI000D3D3C57|nr:hypothetical protein [Paenisporosarcina sp. OV554]PUB09924.1 hypothetical protein C8K15_12328 [Paenisporosarcina sp. OV554]
MAFSKELTVQITQYVYGHLPKEEWYEKNFFPFIQDVELRNRLIVEFKNSRVIYKIFEGLQAKNELLLAQIKTQVVMYVSIQEAVINYVLYNFFEKEDVVQNMLYQERLCEISIPIVKKEKLQKYLEHDGKEILTCFKQRKSVDRTKIRYEKKVLACFELNLIEEKMKDDLINLYSYRNTIHIEAEIKKNLKYDLEMGELAYRRVEGLSTQLQESLKVYSNS